MEMNAALLALFNKTLRDTNSLFGLNLNLDSRKKGYYTQVCSELPNLKNYGIEQAVFNSIIKESENLLYTKLNPIDWVSFRNFSNILNFKNITHIFIPYHLIECYKTKLYDHKNFHSFYELFDKIKIIEVLDPNSKHIYLCDVFDNIASLKFFDVKNTQDQLTINYSIIINNPNVIELIIE